MMESEKEEVIDLSDSDDEHDNGDEDSKKQDIRDEFWFKFYRKHCKRPEYLENLESATMRQR